MKFYRIPPVGEKLSLSGLFSSFEESTSFEFDNHNLFFFDSGTSSLAVALLTIKKQFPAKKEVIIPAYCCPDIVSAILYAGLKPTLLDLRENSFFLNLEDLEQQISADTLAVIAINFSGIKESICELKALLDLHNVALIEDSAQLSPWKNSFPLLADYIVLSFGRGKPESVLHGGALLVNKDIEENLNYISENCEPTDSIYSVFKYIVKVVIYNIALFPWIFAIVSSLPFLHVGKTRYKKLERICDMSRIAKKLLLNKLNAKTLMSEAVKIYDDFFIGHPLLYSLPIHCNANRSGLLRYPVLFPTKELKDQFVSQWSHLGVSVMYPSVLSEISGLEWLVGNGKAKNAQSFAERIVTLPCHSGVSEVNARKILNGISLLECGSKAL